MKRHEFLQDAIGLIDDELVLDAKSAREAMPKTKPLSVPLRWGAFVASLALVVTGTLTILSPNTPTNDPPNYSSSHGPTDDPPDILPWYTPTIAENLWEQGDFKAFSLIYADRSNTENTSASQTSGNFGLLSAEVDEKATVVFDALTSETISLGGLESVKLESLIGDRYVAYYSSPDVAVFYDTREGREVDLTERIIGENRADIGMLIDKAAELAERYYPGMLSTENNRTIFSTYVYDFVNDVSTDHLDLNPDLAFMDELDEFRNTNRTRRKEAFFYTCCFRAVWDAMNESMVDCVYEKAIEFADRLYPAMLSTENNLSILRAVIEQYVVKGTPLNQPVDYDGLYPDTDFMDQIDDLKYTAEEDRRSVFFELCCQTIAAQAMPYLWDTFIYQPYRVEPFAIDPVNGFCLVRVRDMAGNSGQYQVYDIVNDTCRTLPQDYPSDIIGVMLSDGYRFRFSPDGSIVTVVFPECDFSDQVENGDQGDRYITDYMGENVGVFFLDEGKAYRLDSQTLKSSSEAFISKNGAVIYFKQMRESAAGKDFPCSDEAWNNRLELINSDSDQWVFTTFEGDRPNQVTLQGNFVGFISNERAVIMESGGKYLVYSLADGQEITDLVRSNAIEMMAHERLLVYYEQGGLYAKDLFADAEAYLIARADEYILSADGAFAFVYRTGEEHVTCINVVSLEYCTIDMDPQLCQQFFAIEKAVFRMNYNEEENTLSLSFYKAEEGDDEGGAPLDFYAMLEQIGSRSGRAEQ